MESYLKVARDTKAKVIKDFNFNSYKNLILDIYHQIRTGRHLGQIYGC